MLTGSVGGSGWTPDGDITPLQIDGRPAYRLLVTQPSSKGCGYVAESNGYVFMMIGVAPRVIPWKFGQIQEALEKMKLSEQTPKTGQHAALFYDLDKFVASRYLPHSRLW
jgi:hypothetical protein